MFRLLGCTLLGLALCAAGLQAQGGGGGDDKEVVGKVKAVDLVKKSFTITLLKGGKDQTFLVNDKTKFVGPKGGVSTEGLKDDRMAKGSEVRVTPAPDRKTAEQVRFAKRKKKDKSAP
jgi:hypothetical protein